MDMRWLALGVALVGIGLNVIGRLLTMKDSTKQTLGRVGIALVVLGIGIAGYGVVAGIEPGEVKIPTTITQTNPHNSPPIVGNNNTTTINPDVNPNAAIVNYDFNGMRRTTSTELLVLHQFLQ